MESDDSTASDIVNTPDRVWRVWAVSLGMAVILGRFYVIQENHSTEIDELNARVIQALDNLTEEVREGRAEMEAIRVQTRTYQEGALRRDSLQDQRILRLEQNPGQ